MAIQKCPIWDVECDVSYPYDSPDIYLVRGSHRTGGDYEITANAVSDIGDKSFGDGERARATSLLVEQWMKGVDVPRLTADDVRRTKDRPRLPMLDRADRVLRLLVNRSSQLGNILDFIDPNSRYVAYGIDASGLDTSHYECALAWSESISSEELGHLTNYLAQRGWIQKGREIRNSEGIAVWGTDGLYSCVVEVSGYSRAEELRTNPDSAQCFVAMWFDPSMDEAYEKGIRPAIEEDSGYSASRIDRQEFIGKIDDEIIADIRRSRFLVADFTHGSDGQGVVFTTKRALPTVWGCQ